MPFEMMQRARRLVLLSALLTASARVTPAMSQSSAPSVAVTGAVSKPLTLTATELAAMPRVTSSTVSNGITTNYEGVRLSEVLKAAGVPMGPALRGHALAGYVIASASDGYQVVFSLGEIDPEITDGEYLLVDSANGKPLFGENGAFRLLVPRDKRGARSVRMLTTLQVVQVK